MTSAGSPGSVTAEGRSAGAQRVLDAALELFSEHGFEGTSLQDIATRLGVTKAAVYYHFHTKDEILLALVEPAFEELFALAESGLHAQRGQGVQIARYVDYLLRHRRVAAYLTRDATAMSRPAMLEKGARLRGRVEAMLLGGDGDALGTVWGAATLQALAGALMAAPPEASDEWLREELAELGAHLSAGYRKAVRRRDRSRSEAP
ncbi:TetR/AcrR family transcriptional regulator [Modestobacter sp. SYSU DS0290]